MANHPYISGAGNIAQMVNHLRKSFPLTVNSETVKKLGLASNNESYVINAIQFIGLIDEEGKRTQVGQDVLAIHKEEEFNTKFSGLIKAAYHELFELHGDVSWNLSKDDLVQFFRTTDKTSDAIGQRQASVFRIFASLAGHSASDDAGESVKSPSLTKSKVKAIAKKSVPTRQPKSPGSDSVKNPGPAVSEQQKVGLTVRIEINLPAGATKEDYDNIFKSIRANIIDS